MGEWGWESVEGWKGRRVWRDGREGEREGGRERGREGGGGLATDCLVLHLSVAEDLSKVDVEHVPGALHHDVVAVTVADAEDKGRHTVAGT